MARKYVISDRSANPRTARVGNPTPPAPPPGLRRKLLASAARSRLGAPLADQLRRPVDGRRRVPAAAVAGAMLATAGGVALMLAGLQGLFALGAGATAAVLAGAALAWRARAAAALHEPQAAPLFDPETVARVDQALAALAPEVPAGPAQALAEFKATVVRIAQHQSALTPDEHFTFEDRMYVVECVRRYLPDSLQAYLQVPSAQRASATANAPSANALLMSQVQLLTRELQLREEKLAQSATEQLRRQDRFLQSKSR